MTVNRDYVFIFGDDTKPTGAEAVEVVVASARSLPGVERRTPGLRQIGRTRGAYLLRGHAPGPPA